MFHLIMLKYDPQRARAAVQILVDAAYTTHHVKRLRTVVKKPRALPFKDDLEPLNELLSIGRQNLQAMENLIALAEFKKSTRNDYQRDFMAQRRARFRNAIRLQEIVQDKKLSQEERRDLLAEQTADWEAEKERFINQRATAPTWAQRNALIKEFWQLKDKALADELARAEAVHDRGLASKRKRLVVVCKPKTGTAIEAAMQQALHKKR